MRVIIFGSELKRMDFSGQAGLRALKRLLNSYAEKTIAAMKRDPNMAPITLEFFNE